MHAILRYLQSEFAAPKFAMHFTKCTSRSVHVLAPGEVAGAVVSVLT